MTCLTVLDDLVSMVAGSSKPDWGINWYGSDGTLIDFTGDSFRLRIAEEIDGAHIVEKTSGITGSATSYNVVIQWVLPADQTGLVVGRTYWAALVCTSDGNRPFAPFRFRLDPTPS